jgi:hypothetical protein
MTSPLHRPTAGPGRPDAPAGQATRNRPNDSRKALAAKGVAGNLGTWEYGG